MLWCPKLLMLLRMCLVVVCVWGHHMRSLLLSCSSVLLTLLVLRRREMSQHITERVCPCIHAMCATLHSGALEITDARDDVAHEFSRRPPGRLFSRLAFECRTLGTPILPEARQLRHASPRFGGCRRYVRPRRAALPTCVIVQRPSMCAFD